MSSRKQRDELDLLTSRVFLFLLGAFFIALGSVALSTSDSLQQIFSIMGVIFTVIVTMGLVITFIGIAGDDKFVIKTANTTGSHEVLIVFILLAIGIVSVLKRAK